MSCEHEWEALPVPNEGTYRCIHCGALGYIPKRAPGRRSKKTSVRLYRCRSRGCKNVVIKRGYGTGWNLQNACAEHPLREPKSKD